ncbi:glucose-1-phosphate thymidylyltransferase [Allostella vacuolata]|nr:glucose-1-phosphate thymidylyltransferase [Stella vacuolata]
MLRRFIGGFEISAFRTQIDEAPWAITLALADILPRIIQGLTPGFVVQDGIAIHRDAIVEAGAVVKGPAIVSSGCFVAAGAYLRGGVFLDDGCTIGPGCEAKSSILFAGSRLAHLNFVGDSILGADVNCEAGAVIANFRNERADRRIRILHDGQVIDTGVERFGALLGDGVRVGANAVIAPGALLSPGAIVPRLGLVDQSPP